MEELTSSGSVTKSYVLGDDVVSQTVAGQTRFFGADGHGSTRFLTDASSEITERFDYDAYGNKLGDEVNLTNPVGTDLLYTGEQFDPELGDVYLRSRYYNAKVGRFNRQDDFMGNDEEPQSLHKYLYCSCNPTNEIDPSGLESIPSISMGMALMTAFFGIMTTKTIAFLVAATATIAVAMLLNTYADMWIRTGLSKMLELYFKVQASLSQVKHAIRHVLDKLGEVGEQGMRRLFRLPFFLSFRSVYPDIYDFNWLVLNREPYHFKLNYHASRRLARINRRDVNRRWGFLRWMAPRGSSLDEFPYASTLEGGFYAWARMVPAEQNFAQGGLLSAFYRYSKLKGKSGTFLIIPIPL